jgi:hypothetical protein
MTRPMLHALLVSITLAPLAAACAREATPPPGAASPASAPAPSSAADALDRLDARTPVPLLPMMANHQKQNMRDHLLAVQEIVLALGTDDFAAIEASAKRIGFSDKEAAMCNHMGAGAPDFIEQALAFHHQADRIGEAARARDRAKVVTELGATLQTCTSCHATWKQQIVDEATWTRMTGGAPPMMNHGAMPGGMPMPGMDHGAMNHGAATPAAMDHGAMDHGAPAPTAP